MNYIFKYSSTPPASVYNGSPAQQAQDSDNKCTDSEKIFQAIQDKDVEKLKTLLGSVDIQRLGNNARGDGVLIAAIDSGNVESMQTILHFLPQESFLQALKSSGFKTKNPLFAATQSPAMLIAMLKHLDFFPEDQRADLIRETMHLSENILFEIVKSLEMLTALFDFIPKDQHQDLIAKTSNYRGTLLHEALDRNAHGVALALFEALPSSQLAELASRQDKRERTVFLASIQSGNMAAVKKIIDALPQDKLLDLFLKSNRDGHMPLFEAARSPGLLVDLLKHLDFLPPEQRLAVIRKSNGHKNNILWISVTSFDMVNALLQFIPKNQQAALVLENPYHLGTALYEALFHHAYDSAKALIEVFPRMQRDVLCTERGRSAISTLEYAIKSDVFDIVAMMLDLPENSSADLTEAEKSYSRPQLELAIKIAARTGTPDMVTRLLDFLPPGQRTLHIQKADDQGHTLLHFSSAGNRPTLLNLLPETERQACRQRIALDLALDGGDIHAVTNMLNSMPSDQRTEIIQRTDSNGRTFLHRALEKQPRHSEEDRHQTDFDLIKLLLLNGAKVDTKAIIAAVEFRSHGVFNLLLDPKTTELMHADRARREHLLSNRDASLLAAFDSRGWNALMYAIDREDEDAINQLQWHGADRNSANLLLNSYKMSVDDKLKKLFEIQRKVADTHTDNPVVHNMLIIYKLSLEDGLQTARKNRKPDEMLISRLLKGLAIIDEIMPETS